MLCAAGVAAFACKPAARLWRRLNHIPDENGMYAIGEHWFEAPAEPSERSAQLFIRKLTDLRENHLTENNRAFWAVIPDKSYYAQGTGWPAQDFDALVESISALPESITPIDLSAALSLDSFYYADRHWRQEALQPVLDALAGPMGFEAPDLSGFERHSFEGFLGDYARRIGDGAPQDTLVWLTNPDTGAAAVQNLQFPDFHAVYDEARLQGKVPYDVFLSGASPFITIENPNAATDRELVVFRDSYTSSLAPLLCGQYSRITLIDLRYMLTSMLPEQIAFTDQDVLFLYSSWVVNSSAMLR